MGYRNYPDDIVETFVQRCCDNGIDIFRVFDALNDFRNFQTAVKIIKKNNKHHKCIINKALKAIKLPSIQRDSAKSSPFCAAKSACD